MLLVKLMFGLSKNRLTVVNVSFYVYNFWFDLSFFHHFSSMTWYGSSNRGHKNKLL